MTDIDVHFSHPIDNRTIEVTLDGLITGRETIDLLLDNNVIPRSEIGYELALKGGDMIRDDQTLANAGVRNGSIIRILQSSEAGII